MSRLQRFGRPTTKIAIRLRFVLVVTVGTVILGLSSPGYASSSNISPQVAGLSWTMSPKVFPEVSAADHLASVSCVSTTFCVAVDLAGNAFEFDGLTWKSMGRIDAGHDGLWSVDCVSSNFCATADYEGGVLMYDGKGWSRRHVVDHKVEGAFISCASATFCAFVDGTKSPDGSVGFYEPGDVSLYRNSKWSNPIVIDKNHGGFTSVSCPTTNFCEAMTYLGDAYRYSGSTWTGPVTLDFNDSQFDGTSVSCASNVFCVMANPNGHASIFRGATWTPAKENDPKFGSETAVSCVSNNFCASVDTGGAGLVFNGTSWSKPVTFDTHRVSLYSSLSAISCISNKFCVAVGLKYAFIGR